MIVEIQAQIPDMFRGAMKQAPFAISLALNWVAKDAQQKVRSELPKRFHLRNTWTSRGIQVRAANKASLEALVTAPDYMALQETGGTRTPMHGGSLGVPLRANTGDGILRAPKRPRGMLDRPGFFILERAGQRMVAQRKGRRLRILYHLDATQHIAPRFHLFDTVRGTVGARFAMRFDEAFARAVKTGR